MKIFQLIIHVILVWNHLLVIVSFRISISYDKHLLHLADHSDSCKYLNVSSPLALSFVEECHSTNNIKEYECRKVVVSYRSVETYLRRDCVPKGSCSWKDKTQAMINTPVSDCVYTDERSQKLECIYCCDTPLCNRAIPLRMTIQFIIWLLLISYRYFI
jgi:hypothetical protein